MPNIEQIIQDAMTRGEFDNLSGAGKPLDLSAYFDTPEEVRMALSVLKSADMRPQEVDLLKEIAALKDAADTEQDAAKKTQIIKALDKKRLTFNLLVERHMRTKKSGI